MAAKENANPIIHAVRKRSVHRNSSNADAPLGLGDIERFNFRLSNRELSRHSFGAKGHSAGERSVHLSLAHAAASKLNGSDPVGLLQAAGFFLSPDEIPSQNPLLRGPCFVPSSSPRLKQRRDEEHLQHESSDRQNLTTAASALPLSAPKRDTIDSDEVFDIVRNIQDPEHPLTLEQLNVVRADHIAVLDAACVDGDSSSGDFPSNLWKQRGEGNYSLVDVRFTPTIPHCSMATLIGLCIRVKLLRSLPQRFKVTVRINPGTHASEHAVNKQLNDKERVSAALENTNLSGVVDKCIRNGLVGGDS